jgi:hypothetical protein
VRYFKGSIKVSVEHDHPILLQVLRSGFVTQEQLWEFMLLGKHEWRRRSFNWRVKRLVDQRFLERHRPHNATRSFVYSLTGEGANELVNLQHCHTGAVAFYCRKAESDGMTHAIDVNDIQLALARAGLLSKWKSDLEVRSQNEFTDFGYAKDYDAVMMLCFDGQEVECALEYERQAKTKERYLDIAAAIQRERQVNRFLYLLPDYHLLFFVRQFFRSITRQVYFGVSCDFKRELIATQVVGPKVAYGSLKDALCISPLPS